MFSIQFIAVLLTAWAQVSAGAAIDSCLASAGVPVDQPGSSDWNRDSQGFNTRLAYRPAAIVVPTNIGHVTSAVKCASQNGLKVTPKGGGHSYANSGLGGEDGHVVIDFSRQYGVTLDTSQNVATVQAGARLGHVVSTLASQGRGMATGTCPGVGVSGHALHGGYGFVSRKHGLATDFIQSMQVVLANATVVTASATQNTDLFFALRGAGASYGIVTSYQFRTFPLPNQVTYFTINLNSWTRSNAVSNLEALEKWTKYSQPGEITMRLAITARGANLEGLYYGGDQSATSNALAPLLNAFSPKASVSSSTTTSFQGGFQHYAYTNDVDPTFPYSSQETFYSKSLTLKGLNGTSAQNFVNYWFSTANSNSRAWFVQLDLHGGQTSAVTNASTSSSSYAHRDKLYLIQFYDRIYGSSYPSDGYGFLDGWVSTTTAPLPASDFGAYINYADSRLSKTTAQQLYWGSNLARLQKIKAAYDPKDLFYSPLSIQPVA